MKFFKVYIIIVSIWFFSCMTEPISSENQSNQIKNNNIEWFYEIESQELFFQIDLSEIDLESFKVFVQLDPIDDNPYEIFDDGMGYDFIQGNKIYSMIFENIPYDVAFNYTLNIYIEHNGETISSLQYELPLNPPEIIDSEIYPIIGFQNSFEHTLSENQETLFPMTLAIDEKDGQSDIDIIRFYIKKTNFYNGDLINGDCVYTNVQEDEYIDDPDIIENWDEWFYIGQNSFGEYVYRTNLRVSPVQSSNDCGGYGEFQLKFKVQDKKGFYDILELETFAIFNLPEDI